MNVSAPAGYEMVMVEILCRGLQGEDEKEHGK
jgi:hypothetical protein